MQSTIGSGSSTPGTDTDIALGCGEAEVDADVEAEDEFEDLLTLAGVAPAAVMREARAPGEGHSTPSRLDASPPEGDEERCLQAVTALTVSGEPAPPTPPHC